MKMDQGFWLSLVLTMAGAVTTVLVAMALFPPVKDFLHDDKWEAAFALWGISFWIVSRLMRVNARVVALVGRTPTRRERRERRAAVVELADRRR